MNCIIVDDEQLSRIGVEDHIREISFLNLVSTCSNATEAINELNNGQVDLMFLDIQMPHMTGMDLLRTIRNIPLTIIITAYSDHALLSFELEVIDYLIKPVSFPRFLKAVEKAKEYHELRSHKAKTMVNDPFFFIKCDNRIEKIFFDDVLYVQSLQNYVVIQSIHNKFISYLTMKNVEEYFPTSKFVRVNQSNIIAIDKIDNIEGGKVKLKGHTFTIAKTNRDNILKHILGDKFLKRK